MRQAGKKVRESGNRDNYVYTERASSFGYNNWSWTCAAGHHEPVCAGGLMTKQLPSNLPSAGADGTGKFQAAQPEIHSLISRAADAAGRVTAFFYGSAWTIQAAAKYDGANSLDLKKSSKPG